MLYFWKRNGTRTSKTIFQGVWRANTQINKYTNTEIHKYINTQIQMHKYTTTNSQKHKYTNTAYDRWQKYPTYAIFFNSWWFKDVKNDNEIRDPTRDPVQKHRYTVDVQTFAMSPKAYLCNCTLDWLKSQ